jgi:hypothetical protein
LFEASRQFVASPDIGEFQNESLNMPSPDDLIAGLNPALDAGLVHTLEDRDTSLVRIDHPRYLDAVLDPTPHLPLHLLHRIRLRQQLDLRKLAQMEGNDPNPPPSKLEPGHAVTYAPSGAKAEPSGKKIPTLES